jgi:hypothetical protein
MSQLAPPSTPLPPQFPSYVKTRTYATVFDPSIVLHIYALAFHFFSCPCSSMFHEALSCVLFNSPLHFPLGSWNAVTTLWMVSPLNNDLDMLTVCCLDYMVCFDSLTSRRACFVGSLDNLASQRARGFLWWLLGSMTGWHRVSTGNGLAF